MCGKVLEITTFGRMGGNVWQKLGSSEAKPIHATPPATARLA
jgi:hypothetical protein